MIHFQIPGLPPSSNNAYFNLPRGGRSLTAAGKKFKNETKTFLAQRYMKALAELKPNQPYLVYIRLYFDGLTTTTYGKPKGAESRYKKVDASNRVKLLEDVLKDITNVDDSNTMTLIVTKRLVDRGPAAKERTEVFMWNTEQEESPFDEILLSL